MGGDDSDKGGDKPKPIPKVLPSRAGGPNKTTEELIRHAMSKEPIPIAPFEFTDQEQYDACLSPKQTLESYPFKTERAITQLHRELDVRRIVAIAEHAIWREDGQVSQAYFLIIPRWAFRWELRPDDDFWETDYLQVTFPVEGYAVADYERWIKMFNVRFSPVRLSQRAKEPPLETTPAEVVASSGGRPPKPYWEDLLVEMFDQLWHGTLTPNHQSDIEEAMHKWIQGKNYEASSERTVRDRAKKIWKVWIKEGKN